MLTREDLEAAPKIKKPAIYKANREKRLAFAKRYKD